MSSEPKVPNAILPMMALPITIEEIRADKVKGGLPLSSYLMEPKLDGIRCLVRVENHRVEMWTRTGQALHDKVPHIATELSRLPDCVLDGELGYMKNVPDTILKSEMVMDFNRTVRVLGSSIDEAVAKQQQYSDWIQFHIFDILKFGVFGFHTTPFHYRQQQLMDFWMENRLFNGPFNTHFARAYNEESYDTIVDLGGEGVMLKHPDSTYLPGKRKAGTWYKLKKYDTLDAIIVGFEMAKEGKFDGLIGTVVFALRDISGPTGHELVELGRASGMDDATRRDMTENPNAYLNKVVEVKYYGVSGSASTAKGVRHPQFVRIREDKSTRECEDIQMYLPRPLHGFKHTIAQPYGS